MTGIVIIAPEPPDSADVVMLLAASDAYMDSLYPPEDNHLLDVNALKGSDVTFLVAREDGRAIGCAALARRDGYAEVKRMWIEPMARGTGLGRRLLAELERIARLEAIPALRLEMGERQPEAMALYRRAGFTDRGAFGDYPEGTTSVYLEKRLG